MSQLHRIQTRYNPQINQWHHAKQFIYYTTLHKTFNWAVRVLHFVYIINK